MYTLYKSSSSFIQWYGTGWCYPTQQRYLSLEESIDGPSVAGQLQPQSTIETFSRISKIILPAFSACAFALLSLIYKNAIKSQTFTESDKVIHTHDIVPLKIYILSFCHVFVTIDCSFWGFLRFSCLTGLGLAPLDLSTKFLLTVANKNPSF